jgi:hypothetical protein
MRGGIRTRTFASLDELIITPALSRRLWKDRYGALWKAFHSDPYG